MLRALQQRLTQQEHANVSTSTTATRVHATSSTLLKPPARLTQTDAAC
jgi:hypothetical protein